jgi:hypothetical protein
LQPADAGEAGMGRARHAGLDFERALRGRLVDMDRGGSRFQEHRERLVARIAGLQRDLAAIDVKIEIYRQMELDCDEVTTVG